MENAIETEEKIVILGKPQPSCVQHYVDQWVDEADVPQRYREDNNADDLRSYTQGNALRGRKFYWHRKPVSENASTLNEKVITRIKPVEAGAHGTFTITLNSVNEIELGSILELLSIPDDSAFKMGMAKPYGYGSVKINIKQCNLQKDSSRYLNFAQRLSNDDHSLSESDQKRLIQDFERYVYSSVNDGYAESYEDLLPILDLREMMLIKDNGCNRLDDAEWQKRTAYMGSPTDKNSHPSFRDKKILPYPNHVKKYI